MSANEKQTVSITFKTDQQKCEVLDQIAQDLDRDRTYVLNEAINNYLDLYHWQVKQKKKGFRLQKLVISTRRKRLSLSGPHEYPLD
jgi:predicted transcriptional regulator